MDRYVSDNSPKKDLAIQLVFFILTAMVGFLILIPYCYYQPSLSQGDHGRELYAFQATFNGAIPYRDYWWIYGPLMPYYYAMCFKIGGANIQSILFGLNIIRFITGMFVFLSIRAIATPLWGILAATWFWSFNLLFFYTYNHAAAVMMLMIIIYIIFLYLKKPDPKYLYWGLSSTIILALIKINIGICALISLSLSIYLIDKSNKMTVRQNKKFYISAALITPAVILIIYYFFVHGFSIETLRQCFPYLGSDRQYSTSPTSAIINLWRLIMLPKLSILHEDAFGILVLVACGSTVYNLIKNKYTGETKKKICLIVTILLIFTVAFLHEFSFSSVFYRVYWSMFYLMLIYFTILHFGTFQLNRVIRYGIYGTILITIFIQLHKRMNQIPTTNQKHHYLALPKGKILIGNEPRWIRTVEITSLYLLSVLKKNETFLALPYDPLYYYLTDKKSPTWFTAFLEMNNITENQQLQIISDIKDVNYIIVSNRVVSNEQGVGTFGKSHCVVLSKYIDENFKTIQTIGNWTIRPLWNENHGTRILKRKGP